MASWFLTEELVLLILNRLCVIICAEEEARQTQRMERATQLTIKWEAKYQVSMRGWYFSSANGMVQAEQCAYKPGANVGP